MTQAEETNAPPVKSGYIIPTKDVIKLEAKQVPSYRTNQDFIDLSYKNARTLTITFTLTQGNSTICFTTVT
jgi:hypothetical protein